jgi:hypothetical protein
MSFAANERSSSGSAARAEFPPTGYWHRWCGDAPAPTEALTTVQPEAEAEAAIAAAPKVVPTEQGEPPYRVLIV